MLPFAHASPRRTVATLLLLAYLPACTAWVSEGPTPAQYVQAAAPRSVRVVKHDGSHLQVADPTIQGDTLVGRHSAGLAQHDSSYRIAVPLSAEQAVQLHKFSLGRTVGLILGIQLFGLLITKATCTPNTYSC